MNEALLLYLFTRVDVIHGVAVILLIISSAGLLLWQMVEHADTGKFPKIQRWKWMVLAVLFAITLLVPRQKDLAIIIGGTYALEAARSPEAKELGGMVLDVVRAQLKEKK